MPGSFIPNIVELSRTLQARGDRFTYINEQVAGAIWHDDVRRSGASLVLTRTQREVYDALVGARPDVIHTHFIGYTLPATLAAWRTGARLFWHLHTGRSTAPTRIRHVRSRLRYSVLGRSAERFVAVSRALAFQLSAVGLDWRKTTVVNNAIDTERFRPPTPDERALRRQRLGLRPDDVAFAFFGRDSFCKGTDTVLDALSRPSPITLIAVGLPSEFRTVFSDRVRTIALDAVADTRDVYWASDGMLMPSRYDAAPYTLMEALSCGLPTIASSIDSLHELAREISSVRFIPPDDPQQLRRALDELVQGAEPAGLEPAVREFFGLHRWVQDVLALYD